MNPQYSEAYYSYEYKREFLLNSEKKNQGLGKVREITRMTLVNLVYVVPSHLSVKQTGY